MPWWARMHHTMKFSACGGSDLLQRIVWQLPNQLHCIDIKEEAKKSVFK